jgi:hypothetical protein
MPGATRGTGIDGLRQRLDAPPAISIFFLRPVRRKRMAASHLEPTAACNILDSEYAAGDHARVLEAAQILDRRHCLSVARLPL